MKRRSFIQTAAAAVMTSLAAVYAPSLVGPGKSMRTCVPPDGAQFLETRTFSVSEIARFFRVRPHKLVDLERATFHDTAGQYVEFATDTILPWIVRRNASLGFV